MIFVIFVIFVIVVVSVRGSAEAGTQTADVIGEVRARMYPVFQRILKVDADHRAEGEER